MALPHDAVGSDGFSVGLFQQQVVYGNGWWWGDAATCMNPYKSARLFFQRLARLDYNNTNKSPGSFAQTVQRSAYPDRYDKRIREAQSLYNRITGGTVTAPKPDPNRPDFNEYPVWSNNNQPRGGTKIDLFLLHTQEGGGGDDAADNLARWLGGDVNVSYHYTIGQASDGGVTVCDVVDTDHASWSVLSANKRSINLCFAGSRASWTRTQWLSQSKAIDVAAYLAVQDCKKYDIDRRVITPPYTLDPPGISDHRYVTQRLKDGTHTDVGDNFPWDVFAAAVAKYAGQQQSAPPASPRVGPKLVGPADEQIALRWNMLGGQTLVEAVAQIRDKLLGTNDRDKQGVR
ncbi:MAG: N-acetylmuramoyl-L-alanine amidase [Mycobacteriaceae bacterium]|nr:N-acetylmuramoyl-L-alanine amidase [Mycobacteriaceae bacterium]